MSLIHYWPLNEESGSVAADAVGDMDAAVVNGAGTVVTGLLGNARDFSLGSDGNKGHLVLYDGAAQTASLSAWSLSCWVKTGASTGSGNKRLWFFFDSLFTTNGVSTRISSNMLEIQVDLYGPAHWIGQLWTDSVNFGDGGWHLIVVRCDGSSTDLVIDNVVVDTINQAAPLLLKSNHSYFGSEEAASSWLDMAADDLAVFDHELSDVEIAGLWNGGAGNPAQEPQEPPPPFEDWAEDIDPITSQEYYALEIDDGILSAVRIPISSWQGTLQLERASYAQAVIPSALPWVDAVKARSAGDLIIYRGVRHPDGTTQEAEMARAPIQQVRLDQGPINATMTVSGYRTRPAPQQILVRPLQNVRSQSSGAGGIRFRSDIDWFLRPGHQATARGTSIRADYINYYVTGGQAYMDVGQRRAAANPGIAVGQSIASGPALVPSVGVSVSLTDGQSAAAGRVLVPDTGA